MAPPKYDMSSTSSTLRTSHLLRRPEDIGDDNSIKVPNTATLVKHIAGLPQLGEAVRAMIFFFHYLFYQRDLVALQIEDCCYLFLRPVVWVLWVDGPSC